MSVSNIKRFSSRAAAGVLAFMLLLLTPMHSPAATSTRRIYEPIVNESIYTDAGADATIKVYESTFDEFINAVEPIQVTGTYNFTITINAGIFGRHTISLCNSTYTATATDLSFDITSSGVTVDGDVDASWCNFTFPASELNASGDIYYNSSDSTVRFTFSSASVKPCKSISFGKFGTYTICLPFSINIAPTLSIPPVYVGPSLISYETADGTRMLFMRPSNISLQKRNGYIELESDVSF